MRKTLVTLALAGTLGLTGTALLAPSSALAQAGPAGERVSALKSALAGLVTDGTITSAQADRVATALAEQLPPRGHRGGHGGHGRPGGPGNLAPAEVAKALGITVEELRAEHRAGTTLAQVAEAQHIEKADLIARLVTAGKARLATAVAGGRLTQARADELTAGLQARVTEQVDQVGKPGKPHGRHADGAPDGAGAPEAPEPDSAPSGS